jgi:uncharacterized protein (TIGR03086 family)
MTNTGTTSGTNPLVLLGRVLDQNALALATVSDDQRGASTPCRSWTVDELERHLLDDLAQFRVAAQGGRADFRKPVPEFATDDRGKAFRTGAAELLDAWRGQDLDAAVELPFGAVPKSFVVSQQLAEFCVHTWDLLTAAGQPTTTLDEDQEPAEAALAWARDSLRPEFRGSEADGKSFGPEQPVADDAPAYERLAAFFGRPVG